MESLSNKLNLFITKDRYKENVYFARTNEIKFCRFYQTVYGWELWFYPWKIRKRAHSLTQTFNVIEANYKIYLQETYAIHY